MVVIFVHGWSVTNTNTYGQLPARLKEKAAAEGVALETSNLFLGKYVSFRDDVTVDDIARAFRQALAQTVVPGLKPGERFACITHSTGGPVVRTFLDIFGPDDEVVRLMSHLVMLAPANHGSALAQLGKSRLSRLKSLAEGVQPGQRVLDWLELGSAGQWELNLKAIDYQYRDSGLYPFVLTGQSIDRSLYDHLNSYTGEPGSDGVVRVAGANMNYNYICLDQEGGLLKLRRKARSPQMAFGVLPGRSHSGEKMGIIRSVGAAGDHPTVEWVFRCLKVADDAAYDDVSGKLEALTQQTQQAEREEKVEKLFGTATYINNRHSMFTFKMRDDRGEPLADYDLLLTAGPDYSENELPQGFFTDRQRNQLDGGRITYFVDHDVMDAGLRGTALQQKIGFRVVARPNANEREGLAYYTVAELQSDLATVDQLLQPNETVMIEITLRRSVDLAVFQLTADLAPSEISSARLNQLLPLSADEIEARRTLYESLLDALANAKTDEERTRLRKQLNKFF